MHRQMNIVFSSSRHYHIWPSGRHWQILVFEVDVMLTTYWTFFVVFQPAEDAVWMELVSTLKDVLLGWDWHVLETYWTLELLIVKDRFWSVLFPNGVYQEFVATALSASSRAALHHSHDLTSAIAVLTFDIFFLDVPVEDPSFRSRRRQLFLSLMFFVLGPLLQSFLVLFGGFIADGHNLFLVGTFSIAIFALKGMFFLLLCSYIPHKRTQPVN